MQTIDVQLPKNPYPILVGACLHEVTEACTVLAHAVSGRRCMLVSDENVFPRYGGLYEHMAREAGCVQVDAVVLPPGESSKSVANLEHLWRSGVRAGLDRDAVVFALGGGVVGDIAGFFAATYMRGIGLVQIPTSLLADVDSSVGGKVAVDLPEGKNLVGVFHQPKLVLADVGNLASLPPRELSCGLAEVIKYGVIMAPDFFQYLLAHGDELNTFREPLYEEIVARCCRCKAAVVEEDERETGLRAILNYGHTFGHAVETLTGYSGLNHGECVAIGMGMAADLAVQLDLCPSDLPEIQDALLRKAGLPTSLAAGFGLTASSILDAMYRDKKVRQGHLRLVLPTRIGHVELVTSDDDMAIRAAAEGRLG